MKTPEQTPAPGGGMEQEKKQEIISESEHFPVSWLSEDNKVFVVVRKEGGKFSISGEIEDPKGFGEYSDDEYEKMVSKKFAVPPKDISRLKWKYEGPTSLLCDTEAEARQKAQEMLDDRENWLSEKYN